MNDNIKYVEPIKTSKEEILEVVSEFVSNKNKANKITEKINGLIIENKLFVFVAEENIREEIVSGFDGGLIVRVSDYPIKGEIVFEELTVANAVNFKNEKRESERLSKMKDLFEKNGVDVKETFGSEVFPEWFINSIIKV